MMMKIALDIDDTITRCPRFFACLSKAFMKAGHEVHIITFRVPDNSIEQDLVYMNILFTKVHALPLGIDVADWPQWKASLCRELGIEVFFEDQVDVAGHVDASSTLVLMPFTKQNEEHINMRDLFSVANDEEIDVLDGLLVKLGLRWRCKQCGDVWNRELVCGFCGKEKDF